MTKNEDITETLGALAAEPAVTRALHYVKDNLAATIEAQKELVLIEAPSYHEEKKARRYAEMLSDAGLEDIRMDEHFNVWGRIPGVGKTGKAVLLEGHLDRDASIARASATTPERLPQTSRYCAPSRTQASVPGTTSSLPPPSARRAWAACAA